MVPLIGIVGDEKKSIRLANSLNVAFFMLTQEKTIDKQRFDIKYIKEGKNKVMEVCTGDSVSGTNMIINRRFDKSFEAITVMLESHFGSSCFIDYILKDYKNYMKWIIPDVTREEEVLTIKRKGGSIISIDRENELTLCSDILLNDINYESNKSIIESIINNEELWISIDAKRLL